MGRFYHAVTSPARLIVCATALLMSGCESDSPLEGNHDQPFPGFDFSAAFAWSDPVNLGTPINTPFREINASLSDDELSLYFVSNRPGGLGNNDIWVARRATARDQWTTPVNLGAPVNSTSDDGGVSLSVDGRALFFNSNRPGGIGTADLYVSHRSDLDDDLGWGPPTNLGPNVNTETGERGPAHFAHGSAVGLIYFNRGNLAIQEVDLYSAPVTRTGEVVGPAQLEAELSAPGANDAGQSVRWDGREIFFWSNRPGTSGFADIWTSTRHNPLEAWSPPTNAGAPLNTPHAEERPNLSRDGRTLLFDSDRPDGTASSQDIWMSTRVPTPSLHRSPRTER